jgi:tRNA-dihydrouridine synthase B
MTRHLDLMIEIFGEAHGCRMFRKVAPWYAKRFGPASEFNRRIVQLSSKAEYDEILASYVKWRAPFLDSEGELLPRYRNTPLAVTLDNPPSAATRTAIPVPRGPVEVW